MKQRTVMDTKGNSSKAGNWGKNDMMTWANGLSQVISRFAHFWLSKQIPVAVIWSLLLFFNHLR